MRTSLRAAAYAAAIVTLATAGTAAADPGSSSATRRADVARTQQSSATTVAATPDARSRAQLEHALDGQAVTPQTAISTIPTITSPTAGATVSQTITVSATSTAPTVRFALVGATWTQDVAVQGGVASTPLETYGIQGAQQLTATDCDATGCSPAATSVAFTVSNAAIHLTAPAPNTVVGSSVVLSTDATGGGIEYLLDGSVVATAGGPPYDRTVNTSAAAAGRHTLEAIQCNSQLTGCGGNATAPVSIVVQHHLAPQITGVSPSTVSPNGDGRRDSATVRYRLDSQQRVIWKVLNSSGSVVFGPRALGSQTTGTHTVTFQGRDRHGRALPTGSYVVRIDTTRQVSGGTIAGRAEHVVRIDLKAPHAQAPGATPHTFYPVHDGYRDSTVLHTRVSEPLSSLNWEITDSSGHVVRRLPASSRLLQGTVKATWNGRASNGRAVGAGTYHVRAVMRDVAGNPGQSSLGTVLASGKSLHKHTFQKSMTPKASKVKALIGSCSAILYPAQSNWQGSLTYASNYDVCSTRPIPNSWHSPDTPCACRARSATARSR